MHCIIFLTVLGGFAGVNYAVYPGEVGRNGNEEALDVPAPRRCHLFTPAEGPPVRHFDPGQHEVVRIAVFDFTDQRHAILKFYFLVFYFDSYLEWQTIATLLVAIIKPNIIVDDWVPWRRHSPVHLSNRTFSRIEIDLFAFLSNF